MKKREDNKGPITFDGQTVINVELSQEMKKSYIDYAMSVIVGRALPDVRDGLKPVHRRILYTMYDEGLTAEKAHRKCAKIVGDVLGRYHPHGDASVYDALVRMAQDFSLRYPMVDGHGNFGSVDGDTAAAYRYTEARMSKIAAEMLTDIDKDTVDFVPNYDDTLEEPSVLPARFPSLLVNGSSGIAVGMATNIPPHNLSEVCNACICKLDNPEAGLEDLMEYVKGPDFPTGGIIMGTAGIRSAYSTGCGKIRVRAKAEVVEDKHGRKAIIVTELPYQVNKARLVESIAEHIKDKRIDGISFIQDESDRDGMRIAIELKKDANEAVVLNQLYKYTQMQETFSINTLALVDNQPKVLALSQVLDQYISFQKQVITRRTQYDLKKAKEREHILEGLKKALDFIDEVIAIIRANKSIAEAKQALIDRFEFSDIQAQAIVNMRLGQLTGLEREKIEDELNELLNKIADFEDILANDYRVVEILKAELVEVSTKYKDERRTEIAFDVSDIEDEDLIEEQSCVYTLTHFGYIKRMPSDTYKAQRRGGVGISGMTTRDEDFAEELFIGSTHDYILFFTDKGRVYKLKGYQIPESSRTAKGNNIVNLLQMEQGEKITAMIPIQDFEQNGYLTMVTKNGTVKRTELGEYDTARKGGLIAIVLDEDDLLVRVKYTDGDNNLIIGTKNGKAIHFSETDVRPMGRATRGVRGITLEDNDYVIGMEKTDDNHKILTVTENGYGKRTDISEYKIQNRAGKGLLNYNITDKTGLVAAMRVVDENDDILLISSEGVIIRMGVSEIPIYGRATQGVRVMKMRGDEKVVTVARTDKEADEQTEQAEESTDNIISADTDILQ